MTAVHKKRNNRFLFSGILGAVAPDLDMIYFHLADHRQHHHHTYWTHFPVLWAGLLLVSMWWFRRTRSKPFAAVAVIFSLNGFVHMLLDSIAGDIWWFAPMFNIRFSFFTVPALYTPWWLNFLLHWTFALELAVTGGAVFLWYSSRQVSRRGMHMKQA